MAHVPLLRDEAPPLERQSTALTEYSVVTIDSPVRGDAPREAEVRGVVGAKAARGNGNAANTRFHASLPTADSHSFARDNGSGNGNGNGDAEFADVQLLQSSHVRLALFYVLCILPLPIPGTFLLLARWFPQLFSWVARSKVEEGREHAADFVLVRGPVIQPHLSPLHPSIPPNQPLLAPTALWSELPVHALSLPAPSPPDSAFPPQLSRRTSGSNSPRTRLSSSTRMESDHSDSSDSNSEYDSSSSSDQTHLTPKDPTVTVRYFEYRKIRYYFHPPTRKFVMRPPVLGAFGSGVYDGSVVAKKVEAPRGMGGEQGGGGGKSTTPTVEPTPTSLSASTSPSPTSTTPLSLLSHLSLHPSLSHSQSTFLASLYPPNSTTPPTTTWSSLILSKLSTPFYIFQLYAAVIWALEGYFTFSLFVVSLSTAGVLWEATIEKSNETRTRFMADKTLKAHVIRDGVQRDIPAESLVPGDTVLFSPTDSDPTDSEFATVQADMVLLRGTVVVDESTLTGETVPVVKSGIILPPGGGQRWYDEDTYRSSTLFAGTRIVQVKPPLPTTTTTIPSTTTGGAATVTAVVLRTGFSTSRGQVFRNVLYPTGFQGKFESESWKVLCVMAVVGLVAGGKRVWDGITHSRHPLSVLLTSLDILTTAIPPALPIVLTVGTGMAMTRLRRKKVLCTMPERCGVVGGVGVMCWDKTGTLTTTSLSFSAIDTYDGTGAFTGPRAPFSGSVSSRRGGGGGGGGGSGGREVFGDVEVCLATCHGVSKVDGKVVGYSVDTEMFAASGCELIQPPTHPLRISSTIHLPLAHVLFPPQYRISPDSAFHILRRFDFDASLQRASSIISLGMNGPYACVAKGSPESIATICDPASLPDPQVYEATYQAHTTRGFYVLACAVGDVNGGVTSAAGLESTTRDTVERGLRFAGFVLLRNPTKPESVPTLTTLKGAGVRNVMITGDDVRTAVHVAREVGIMDKKVAVFVVDTVDKPSGGAALVFYEIPTENDVVISPVVPGMADHLGRMTTGAPSDGPRRNISELRRWVAATPGGGEIAVRGRALEVLKEEAGIDVDGGDSREGEPEADGVHLLDWIVKRASVFARTKPSQKTWIVERLMGMGQVVGMCGDGTNDCGALKAAHAGLALSDAEASIVAHFTSTGLDVGDAVTLLLEGRCALDTSFTAFKYMIMYAVVQLVLSLSLSHVGSTLNNNQWLIDDIFIVAGLAFWMVYTGPAPKLSLEPPADSLFHPSVVVSIAGQSLLYVWFYSVVGVMMYSPSESWFCSVSQAAQFLQKDTFLPLDPAKGVANFPCYEIDPRTDVVLGQLQKSHENAVFWEFAHFQFLVTALGVTIVARHRLPFWTNRIFVVYLCLLFLFLSFIILTPDSAPWSAGLNAAFNMRTGIPESFRLKVWAVALADLVVCGVLWELLVVDRVVPWVMANMRQRKKVGWGGKDQRWGSKSQVLSGRGWGRGFRLDGLKTGTEWVGNLFSGLRVDRSSAGRFSTSILRRQRREGGEDATSLLTRRTRRVSEAFEDEERSRGRQGSSIRSSSGRLLSEKRASWHEGAESGAVASRRGSQSGTPASGWRSSRSRPTSALLDDASAVSVAAKSTLPAGTEANQQQ